MDEKQKRHCGQLTSCRWLNQLQMFYFCSTNLLFKQHSLVIILFSGGRASLIIYLFLINRGRNTGQELLGDSEKLGTNPPTTVKPGVRGSVVQPCMLWFVFVIMGKYHLDLWNIKIWMANSSERLREITYLGLRRNLKTQTNVPENSHKKLNL